MKFSVIITDSASTMTSAWKTLTDNKHTCGNLDHILFMSCTAHMIHNYIKEILNDPVFKDSFDVVKSCIQLCRQKEFRVFISRKYNTSETGFFLDSLMFLQDKHINWETQAVVAF